MYIILNLQLRSLSSSSEIAQHDDILRIFLMACEVKTVKLSVIGLSCLQKLIAHDAVAPSALNEILATLIDVSAIVSCFFTVNCFIPHNGFIHAPVFYNKQNGLVCVCIHTYIIFAVFQHGEMADEGVQLKTLQTVLIIFQSRLQPDSEVRIAKMLLNSFFTDCFSFFLLLFFLFKLSVFVY